MGRDVPTGVSSSSYLGPVSRDSPDEGGEPHHHLRITSGSESGDGFPFLRRGSDTQSPQMYPFSLFRGDGKGRFLNSHNPGLGGGEGSSMLLEVYLDLRENLRRSGGFIPLFLLKTQRKFPLRSVDR